MNKALNHSPMSKSERIATSAIIIVLIAAVPLFWFYGVPRIDTYVNPAAPVPTETECKKIFDDSIQGFFGYEMEQTAKACGGKERFKTYLSTVHSRYSIDGNALTIGNAVLSLNGMAVVKTETYPGVIGLGIPTIVVSVADRREHLLFGSDDEALHAFRSIGDAIGHAGR